jgi:hypothetical protein
LEIKIITGRGFKAGREKVYALKNVRKERRKACQAFYGHQLHGERYTNRHLINKPRRPLFHKKGGGNISLKNRTLYFSSP